MTDTLSFVRPVHSGKDYPAKGRMYVHRWATGMQDLVFDSDASAEQWAKTNNAEYVPPYPARNTRYRHASTKSLT